MADKFTVGLVQMKCATNVEENLERAIEKIQEAAARGAQIICLHELFRGEYFCRIEDADLPLFVGQQMDVFIDASDVKTAMMTR